jgi:TetR/AcrR family transcriptional regulator
MSAVEAIKRVRDAERSRRAILEAAEAVFAERGFPESTLSEIGRHAGLSRGAPAFFFESKDNLYAEVIKRVFAERHEVLGPALELARTVDADEAPSRDALQAALEAAVGSYIDFLASRPTFVRLMQWEALTDGQRLRAIPHESSALERGLSALAGKLPKGDGRGEAGQLLLSFVALCLLPFEHDTTLLPTLGVSATDGRFLRERKRHVVRLLLDHLTIDRASAR